MTKTPAPPSRSLADLRDLTPARVGLGRAGASLPTEALLSFTLDHARARDAVHAAFDAPAIVAGLGGLGLEAIEVHSRARERTDYLRRPDLGRTLDEASQRLLAGHEVAGDGGGCRLAIVVADGLSPAAVNAHAIPLLRSLVPRLATDGIEIGRAVVARGARVALGDEIGAMLGARMIVMLIGERPGLSASDSLGAYLTFAPKIGRTDAERNCVSNIHGLGAYLTFAPKIGRTDAQRNCVSNIHGAGLGHDEAAFRIGWLVREGLARGVTGVGLKDESGESTPRPIAAN